LASPLNLREKNRRMGCKKRESQKDRKRLNLVEKKVLAWNSGEGKSASRPSFVVPKQGAKGRENS